MVRRGKIAVPGTLEAYHQSVAGSMLEDTLLSAVMETARYAGWRVYHVRNSKAGIIQGSVGFPDLCMVNGKRLVFAELKRERAKTTEAQNAWLEDLRGVPGVEVYVWRPSDYVSGAISNILRETEEI